MKRDLYLKDKNFAFQNQLVQNKSPFVIANSGALILFSEKKFLSFSPGSKKLSFYYVILLNTNYPFRF